MLYNQNRTFIPVFANYTMCAALTLTTVTGCGGSRTSDSETASRTTQGNASATDKSSNAAPKSTKPATKVKINEQEMKAALGIVSAAVQQISFMSDDAGFERSRTGKDNAHGIIDVAAVKKGLEVVSILPDNKDNQFLPVFSVQFAKVREVIQLYDAAIASGKPFSDGTDTGPKMVKLAADHGLSFTVASTESMAITDKQ